MDLTPELIIAAYCRGAFPMAHGRDSDQIDWFSPDPRAILPLDGFHLPRSLDRIIRRGTFRVRHDTAFEQVMRGCAAPRRSEQETWINEALIRAYTDLHRAGFAHSIEVWRTHHGRSQLVGGLYGVAIGGAFFGESMFHLPGPGTNASKVALAATVDHLNERRYRLFDTQFTNPFLEPFGVVEIDLADYLHQLQAAVKADVTWR